MVGGAPVGGTLEVTIDGDFFSMDLAAGQSYTIPMGPPKSDTFIFLYDAAGTIIAGHDDVNPPAEVNASLTYTPTASGPHYVGVGFGKPGVTPAPLDYTIEVQ